MKATLHFELPEDEYNYRNAINGWRWRAVVSQLDEDLRHELTYNEPSEAVAARIEALRAEIHALLQEYNLTLDED